MAIRGTCFRHRVPFVCVAQEPPASEAPGSIALMYKLCGFPLHPVNQNIRGGAKGS